MNEFFKKFKNALVGEPPKKPDLNPLANQELIDKVFEVYKTRFKEESTRQTMLFPTCFRIYVHSTDFKARQDAFNVLARDMANEFNNFSRTEMHKYKNNIPHAEYWLFQFVELQDGAQCAKIDYPLPNPLYRLSTKTAGFCLPLLVKCG